MTEEAQFRFEPLDQECKTQNELFYYDRTQKVEIIKVLTAKM